MKKIDPVVKKETAYIALVSFLLSLLLQSVFLVLNKWDLSVLWGNLWGFFISVGNFFLLGLTVQKAVKMEEKEAKTLLRVSQSARLFGLFLLAGAAYLVPFLNLIAAVIPYLFPRFAIALRPLFKKG